MIEESQPDKNADNLKKKYAPYIRRAKIIWVALTAFFVITTVIASKEAWTHIAAQKRGPVQKVELLSCDMSFKLILGFDAECRVKGADNKEALAYATYLIKKNNNACEVNTVDITPTAGRYLIVNAGNVWGDAIRRLFTLALLLSMPLARFFSKKSQLKAELRYQEAKKTGTLTLSPNQVILTVYYLAGVFCLLVALWWALNKAPFTKGGLFEYVSVLAAFIVTGCYFLWAIAGNGIRKITLDGSSITFRYRSGETRRHILEKLSAITQKGNYAPVIRFADGAKIRVPDYLCDRELLKKWLEENLIERTNVSITLECVVPQWKLFMPVMAAGLWFPLTTAFIPNLYSDSRWPLFPAIFLFWLYREFSRVRYLKANTQGLRYRRRMQELNLSWSEVLEIRVDPRHSEITLEKKKGKLCIAPMSLSIDELALQLRALWQAYNVKNEDSPK